MRVKEGYQEGSKVAVSWITYVTNRNNFIIKQCFQYYGLNE